MTDLDTLISIVQAHATNENRIRFGGKDKIKVEKDKKFIMVLYDRASIGWHYEVPNHFCVFIDTFAPGHYAAYVYVWEEEDILKCTLRISGKDGAEDPQELLSLNKSLDDDEIASMLIETVIYATKPQ
jgi:hypothetical protein